jgi:hypothetical protein
LGSNAFSSSSSPYYALSNNAPPSNAYLRLSESWAGAAGSERSLKLVNLGNAASKCRIDVSRLPAYCKRSSGAASSALKICGAHPARKRDELRQWLFHAVLIRRPTRHDRVPLSNSLASVSGRELGCSHRGCRASRTLEPHSRAALSSPSEWTPIRYQGELRA